MVDVPATQGDAAFFNVQYAEHHECRMAGWYPVDGADMADPAADMPVYIRVPGQGGLFTPFYISAKLDSSGAVQQFLQNSELINSLRRNGHFVVLISYPRGITAADSTGAGGQPLEGHRQFAGGATLPVMAKYVAKAVQFLKSNWSNPTLMTSGGTLSQAANKYVLAGSSWSHILSCMVAYSEDGAFDYSPDLIASSERSFTYTHSHRVRGVVGTIGALNFKALADTISAGLAGFGAPEVIRSYADVPEAVRVRMSPWYRIAQKAASNQDVGHVATYSLIEGILGSADLTRSEILTAWATGTQLNQVPVNSGVVGYTDPHMGAIGPALEDLLLEIESNYSISTPINRVYWGNDISNNTAASGYAAWRESEGVEIAGSTISFDPADGLGPSIFDSANGFSSIIGVGSSSNSSGTSNRWLHVTGASNAANNSAWEVHYAPSDGQVVLRAGSAIVTEAAGNAISCKQTNVYDNSSEVYDFITNNWGVAA